MFLLEGGNICCNTSLLGILHGGSGLPEKVKGGDPSLLSSSGEVTPRVLDFSVHERQGSTERSPV